VAARFWTTGRLRPGGPVSGSRVRFTGDAMAAVVHGVLEVRTLIGRPPVIVGGLAVLSRLSTPYRATVDLDVVDRLLGDVPQLQVLRIRGRGARRTRGRSPADALQPGEDRRAGSTFRQNSTAPATTLAIVCTPQPTPGRTTRPPP
jgi:hypothetical protein